MMGKEGAIYKFPFCDWLVVVRKTPAVQSKSKISRRLEKPAELTPTVHFIVEEEEVSLATSCPSYIHFGTVESNLFIGWHERAVLEKEQRETIYDLITRSL